MPALPFVDLATLDFDHPELTLDDIRKVNPQRFEFEMLSAILFIDPEKKVMAAYKDLTGEDFWVRGHIPGRPLFPGVLMIECAAQLVSYYVMTQSEVKGFLGFGGVDQVKFRGQVKPGERLIMLGKMLEMRGRRRNVGATQGYVNGEMVFEGIITGMII